MSEEFQKAVEQIVDKEAKSLTVIDNDTRAHRQAVKQSRSVQGMEKKWQDKDRAALQAAISANAPPVKSEPKCSVCQSPHRLWVERQLIRGISYLAIAKSVPGVNEDTFRRALSTHYKNHMDLEGAQVRAIMEEESDMLQQNYEEGIQGAFSYRAALDIMIRKGYSDVLDNITTVEPKDMVKFIEMAEKMNSASATQMVEEARASINIFMEAIRNVFTDNLERDQADFLSGEIVKEVKRLREQNELEAQIEDHMRQLPSGKSVDSNPKPAK